MSRDTATEHALMLTASGPSLPAAAPSQGPLTARERELVTLVAQGRTNTQIAAQLYISVRTVSSHLDRIRDKTGCRRRADLTRLAFSEGLVLRPQPGSPWQFNLKSHPCVYVRALAYSALPRGTLFSR
jgi:DNA-binding NarL/FixJ family response regulator